MTSTTTPTSTFTPTPTATARPYCTPPSCSSGRLICPDGTCDGGCGYVCEIFTQTPTRTPTQTPTWTVTSTPSYTPTQTPTLVWTSTSTPTRTSTPTNTRTQTPTSTPTNTPVPPCTFSFPSGPPGNLPPDSGNGYFTVNTQPGCSWTAESGTSWITVTSSSPTVGSGGVSYQVAANYSFGGYRTGRIVIAGNLFFTIVQNGR